MMVTRIPPMIAVEPTAFDEHTTVLEGSSDSDVTQKRTISMRPILYYSYEGQVAVQGIITILPTRVPPQASKFNQGMQSPPETLTQRYRYSAEKGRRHHLFTSITNCRTLKQAQ